MCDKKEKKHKETPIAYGNEVEEKTSSMYENKEKARGGYVRMHECGKHLFNSTYEHTCTSKTMSISNTEDFVAYCNSDYEDMVKRINIYHNESERCDAYLKQSTTDFEEAVTITVDSDSVITQEKQSGNEEYFQVNIYN